MGQLQVTKGGIPVKFKKDIAEILDWTTLKNVFAEI